MVGPPDEVAAEPGEPAEDRAGDRDTRSLPGVPARVLDVRAEERHEHRPRRVQTLARGLEVVAHLVQEDQDDDTESELPAPDQRVAAEGDEDRRELDQEPELRRESSEEDDRREDLPREAAPVAAARL